MILLADSGSTKTDWCIMENCKAVRRIKTGGMNPFQMTSDEIAKEIRSALIPELPTTIFEEVHFYGAGCTLEKQPIVAAALRTNLTINGACEVASDMLAAARSICGHEPGIACILGTGSNSCAYDGHSITHNVSPLGFILGDEGSGAVMGKLLVADILKAQMPRHIIDRFNEEYKLTPAEIIDRVYRQKMPNQFLASFVPFLAENLNEPCIYRLVKESFRSFLRRNVMQYEGWQSLPIGFNGSIALFFRAPLEEVMKEESMHLGRIIQAPMEGLVEFYR